MAGSPPEPPFPSPPDARSVGGRDIAGPGFGVFRQLTFHAVMGGLCPLVPVPFLDDWLLGRVKRWMIADLDQRLGTGLDSEAKVILAGGRDPWGVPGCVAGCVWVVQKAGVALVVKLFRKVLYFLAIRDGLHAATEVFHEGYLAAHGLRQAPAPPRPEEQREHVRRLRAATRQAMEEMDLQPVRDGLGRSFRGSRGLLLRASRVLAKPFLRREDRRAAGAADGATEATVRAREEELLGGLVDRLAAALWGNREYFRGLERTFERHFESGGERSRNTTSRGPEPGSGA